MSELEEIDLWKAYHQLTEVTSRNPLNEIKFPITSPLSLSDSLTFLSKKLKIPLYDADSYFAQSQNPDLKKDKLDPNHINLLEFQMRLSNYLLEQIHKQGSYTESVHEFLFDSFKTREEAKGNPISSDSEAEQSEGSIEDKLFLSSLVDQVMEGVRNDKKKKKTEKKDIEAKVKVKRFAEFKRKWNDDMLEEHKQEILDVFNKYQRKGEVMRKDMRSIVNEVVKIVNLFVEEYESRELLAKFDAIFAGKNSTVLEIESFGKMMKEWGSYFNLMHKSFKGKLIKTFHVFDDLRAENEEYPNLKITLAKVTEGLSQLIKKCQLPHKSMSLDVQKNLEETFLFYGKAQKIQGAENTFEGLELSNSTWNMGKFLRFCQDFNIQSLKATKKPASGLSLSQLQSIFHKTSKNSIKMEFNHFLDSLHQISESLFPSSSSQTENPPTDLNEKFSKLISFLSLDDPNSFHKKLIGFNKPHSPESHCRIPKITIRKSSCDYQLPDSFIKNIEDWKNKKCKQHNLTPNIFESKIKPALAYHNKELSMSKKHRQIRNSSEDTNVGGYAFKAKRKGQLSSLSPTQRIQESSESIEVSSEARNINQEKISLSMTKVKINQPSIVNNRFITFQDLNRLDYRDFDQSDFRELLQEDSNDEYFEKFFKIEPKLQGIFKMHQDKVEKGMKVIEKSKPLYLDKRNLK